MPPSKNEVILFFHLYARKGAHYINRFDIPVQHSENLILFTKCIKHPSFIGLHPRLVKWIDTQ